MTAAYCIFGLPMKKTGLTELKKVSVCLQLEDITKII